MQQMVRQVRPQDARLYARLLAWAQARPRPAAAIAAALAMSLALLAGALDGLERRASDAWFGLRPTAPSGHTVLVTFDHAAAPAGGSVHVSRRDLAELLLKLDAAGAERILVEVGIAEQSNGADDTLLEGALAKLGRKVAVTAAGGVASDPKLLRGNSMLGRFARYARHTASDLGLDPDGAIRRAGINASGRANRVLSSAWLSGARRVHGVAPETFRIDFGIDLARIPRLEAASVLRGETRGLAGARVVIAGAAAAPGNGLHVPRYGELTRPEVTALAAETLALRRALRAVPFAVSAHALILIAALIAYWCVPRTARTAACLCGAIALGGMALGAALQIFAGIIAPAVGVAVAALLGCVAARVMVHPAFQRVRQSAVTVLTGVDVARLSRIASQDALTGVANRRGFDEALRRACAGNEGQFALLLCDLDRFKQINDAMGHQSGDALLREIAGRLVAATGGGLVARLGGDEFAILLAPATTQHADEVARRLVDAVGRPVALGDRSVTVGISIGIALGVPGSDEAALMEAADAAMYAAKRTRAGYGFAAEPAKPVAPAAGAPAADARQPECLYADAG